MKVKELNSLRSLAQKVAQTAAANTVHSILVTLITGWTSQDQRPWSGFDGLFTQNSDVVQMDVTPRA
jgi:hypothetical protein